MRKLFMSYVWVISLALIFASCSEENDTEPLLGEEEAVEESEISLLEKETGITFFKKDIKLTDNNGENTVVLRIASKDEEILDQYLDEYSFSIAPINKEDLEESRNIVSPKAAGEESTENKTDGILSEFISQRLDKNVVGVKVLVKAKNLENGRPSGNGFPYDVTFYSNTWPEEFECWAYAPIGYKLEGKSRWYSGWSTRTFCSLYYPYNCQSYWQQSSQNQWLWIDGPYKVRVIFDYTNANDFTFSFIGD